MTAPSEKKAKLQTFTEWVAKHISGDEKGEAQVFLDRLFQAFGEAVRAEAQSRLPQSLAAE